MTLSCAETIIHVTVGKDGKYSQRTLWYKILNPAYTQKAGRHEFFQRR